MVILGDFSKKREENLIEFIDTIKDVISKDDGTLKIIVRLFLKMCEDGFLEKNTALTDLEDAKKVYLEKRKEEENPRVLFIFSPLIHECFGDEELYNMTQFYEMIGEDPKKVLGFAPEDKNVPGSRLNKISASCSFLVPKLFGNGSTLLSDNIEVRTRVFKKAGFKLIDIIRYILGIYEIKDNEVIITTPEIYPKINNRELALSILEQHYQIMLKEDRFINPYEPFSGIRTHRAYIDYLTSSFTRTTLDIDKLVNFAKDDLDTLVKWGMLTLDNQGLYHVNYETYAIFPFTLNFDARLKDLYKHIFDIFRFFHYNKQDENTSRTNFIQRMYKKFEGFNLTSDDIDNITFFTDKFNYIFSNYWDPLTWESLTAFDEFCDELDLFGGKLEKSMSRVREK